MPPPAFPISVGANPSQGRKEMQIRWAKPGASPNALMHWSHRTQLPAHADAVELAVMTATKWKLSCRYGTVAASLDELRELAKRHPRLEITALLIAEADWFAPALGCCLVHRTWANHLFLDYLAVNPATKEWEPAPLTGIGTWLLYSVCEIAEALDDAVLWGETTEISAPFYAGMFALGAIDDRLTVERSGIATFCTKLRQRLRESPTRA